MNVTPDVWFATVLMSMGHIYFSSARSYGGAMEPSWVQPGEGDVTVEDIGKRRVGGGDELEGRDQIKMLLCSLDVLV